MSVNVTVLLSYMAYVLPEKVYYMHCEKSV